MSGDVPQGFPPDTEHQQLTRRRQCNFGNLEVDDHSAFTQSVDHRIETADPTVVGNVDRVDAVEQRAQTAHG